MLELSSISNVPFDFGCYCGLIGLMYFAISLIPYRLLDLTLAQLRLIESASETEQLALDCGAGGSEGVVFVPAFAGLFAPHWREDARGTVCGLTAFHERKHMVKAALDAAAFQAYEVKMDAKVDAQICRYV